MMQAAGSPGLFVTLRLVKEEPAPQTLRDLIVPSPARDVFGHGLSEFGR